MTLLLLTFVLTPTAKAFPTENFCHDAASWSEWEALIQDNPFDKDLMGLYALRIGLCVLVERKRMTVEDATDVFERQRSLVLERKEVEIPKDAITQPDPHRFGHQI